MSFDRKFSELSQSEQKAAKEKYGSRKNWQDAKARSQGHKDRASAVAAKSAPTANNQALNNEHSPKANDVGSAAKPAASSSGLRKDGFASVGPDGRPVTVYGAEAEKAKAESEAERAESSISGHHTCASPRASVSTSADTRSRARARARTGACDRAGTSYHIAPVTNSAILALRPQAGVGC